MILNNLPLPSKERILELSTIIAHCPLAKNFLHLGCEDGLICEMVSNFLQFEHVIGLDYNPHQVALCISRKLRVPSRQSALHFYFHNFGYPFREVPAHTLTFLSIEKLSIPLQNQVCYWMEKSGHIVYIATSLPLPLHSKKWGVKAIEGMGDSTFYIYERLV